MGARREGGTLAFRVRDGNVTVTLDDGLSDLVAAAIDRALPGVRARMVADSAEILDFAVDEWPVKTGRSRAGLELVQELDLGRSSFAVRARNDVDYAIFVKPAKWHGATTAWQRLVRGPMTSLHKELTETLGPVIVAALRSGARR